jgi:hypothetical protein
MRKRIASVASVGWGEALNEPVCLTIGDTGFRTGVIFFTVNLLERRMDTLVPHIDRLREAVRVRIRASVGWGECNENRPAKDAAPGNGGIGNKRSGSEVFL